MTPGTPNRRFAIPTPPPPIAPPVPAVIPAWKGKASLREVGLLGTVEAVVAISSGRVADAWVGAAEWQRDSAFLSDLAGTLGLSAGQVDQMFRDADAIPV